MYLDTIGLLPTPDELHAFLADTDPAKRAKLIDKLLADNQAYAEHWLSFWNDLLRNDYVGTGYIDGGRKQISGWLYHALLAQQAVRPVRARADRAVAGSRTGSSAASSGAATSTPARSRSCSSPRTCRKCFWA